MTEEFIKELSEVEFAKLFKRIIAKIKEDPIANFVKAKGFMNFTPSPVQEVILKVIFQKRLNNTIKRSVATSYFFEDKKFSLVKKEMTEIEIYEYITGKKYKFISANAEDVINKINLVCGRRSGKTTLAAIIATCLAIINNWKPLLKTTPFATVLILSHSREFSDEVLDTIKQFVSESPVLNRLKNKDRKQTASTFNLKVPFLVDARGDNPVMQNSLVQIKVGAASSRTTRGIACCAVICDEIAFWNLDDTFKETDEKILTAVRPSMKQFGKKAMLLKLSSPGIRQGVLYDEYKRFQANDLPPSYVVFKAPLWSMNEVIPTSELEEEHLYDSDSFDIEYGADFLDSLSTFIMGDSIESATLKGVTHIVPTGDKEVTYHAALDAAFKNDKFTFTVIALEGDRITQQVCKGWQGTKKNPVKSGDVAKWIKNAIEDYPVAFIAADHYAFEPLREIFAKNDLVLKEYPFNTTFKKKIYYGLKKLFHSNQIEILDVENQLRELRSLIVEQTPSGQIKISHPRTGSDDYADSLAVASYLGVSTDGKLETSPLTQEEEAEFGITVDANGVSVQAPSVNILVNSGHLAEQVFDNSKGFGIDPSDGRLKPKADFEDEEEEDGDALFSF